ncbi:RNA polymerase sigma factor [Aquimarina sp. RZ0]|uniref:RNA polymerase sigma factor n=1 Tax=Aquimarina sp. RZ0 TaxID=2607730 RepID=UPI001CB72FAA|nr:RNA polymerase sigma factor [Aquimarina sp. RZ0]
MISLNDKVKSAVEGDKKALEEIVIQIQGLIYNLAVRMLWHPDDAKDTTQEILIKVITNLSSFNHKSKFTTWVYRLASNTLINFQNKKLKQQVYFDQYEHQLQQGFSETIAYTTNKAEQNLLIQEAKIGCSNAMLQCLNRESRLTYIIGEILEFNSREGAIICNITPENFRKRLSRSKKSLHNFLHKNCGIINTNNTCRCYKKVDNSIKNKNIQPDNLLFAKDIKNTNLIKSIEYIQNEVDLYRSNPEYDTPDLILKEVRKIVSTNRNI